MCNRLRVKLVYVNVNIFLPLIKAEKSKSANIVTHSVTLAPYFSTEEPQKCNMEKRSDGKANPKWPVHLGTLLNVDILLKV